MRRRRGLAGAVLLALGVAMPGAALPAVAGAAPTGGEGTGPLPEIDAGAAPSLSDAGRRYAAAAGGLADAPRYALTAEIAPRRGHVDGRLRAEVPAPTDGEVRFRVFAGLLGAEADLVVDDVAVAGEAVDAELDASLLTIPVDASAPSGERVRDRVEVSMRFSYRLPEVTGGGDLLGGLGDGLDPAEIGLLARHRGGVTLGHWFPVWLPPGVEAEAEPDGFGDIGNFPAAVFRAHITVPEGWDVVSGGVNVDRRDGDGGVTYVEEGTGLRDLAVYAGRNRVVEEVDAGDAAVRVVGPRSARDDVAGVGAEAQASLVNLGDAFGPYPWTELDVVSVPLGSSVAGMEWPGMIWIESALFEGGIPGLGDLGDLGDLDDVFGDLGDFGEIFDDLFGEMGDLGDIFGLAGLDSMREFVVAHEVAHQW